MPIVIGVSLSISCPPSLQRCFFLPRNRRFTSNIHCFNLFCLLLNLSTSEFIIPGRNISGTPESPVFSNPDIPKLNISYGPSNHDYVISNTPYLGGGVGIENYTFPHSDNAAEIDIELLKIEETNPRVAEDPFYERTARLEVKVANATNTDWITKTVMVRQIFYSMLVTGTADYYFIGQEYSFTMRANTAWNVSFTGDNIIENITVDNVNTTAGIGKTATTGEVLKFKVKSTALDGQQAVMTISNPDNLFVTQKYIITVQKKHPNSYILKSGNSTKLIPVSKAFHVWKHDRDLLTDLPATGATYTAKLLWQDVNGLITNVDWINATPASDGSIFVRTGTAGLEGNAVVAFLIDGTIVWSWHIWVTNYEPDAVGSNVVNGASTIMDRNLGALANNPGTGTTAEILKTYGLYYQAGRKDPFPEPNAMATGNFPTRMKSLYDINGTPVTFTTEMTPSGKDIDGGPNLEDPIENPMMFYYCNYGVLSWYGGLIPHRSEFWTSRYKTDYDPCPEGWMVASIYAIRKPTNVNLTGVPLVDGGFDTEIGFFPGQGNISSGSGDYYRTPTTCYMFNTTDVYVGVGQYYFGDNQVTSNFDSSRTAATGCPVRCMKEQ